MQRGKSNCSELRPGCDRQVWVNDAMLDANWFGLALCVREGDEEERNQRRIVHSARRPACSLWDTLSKGYPGDACESVSFTWIVSALSDIITMPTVAVDKADLFERLGREYSECLSLGVLFIDH